MNHCRPLVYNTKYKGKMCKVCTELEGFIKRI